MNSADQSELIGPLLKRLARSLCLTLRILPREIRPQISLAYLLARASDTIADTKVVARGTLLEILKQFRGGLGLDGRLPDVRGALASVSRSLSGLIEHQATTGEKALLDPGYIAVFQPIYDHWLDTAVAELDAGWQYTQQLPHCLPRLRLACIWPIWIRLQTIALLRHGNPLDPARPIKLARGAVYKLLAWSVAVCGNDTALDTAFRRLRAGARAARLDTDAS